LGGLGQGSGGASSVWGLSNGPIACCNNTGKCKISPKYAEEDGHTLKEVVNLWNRRPREQKLERICRELVKSLKGIKNSNDVFWDSVGVSAVEHIETLDSDIDEALERAELIAGEE
jgi:hypothetical protein